MTREPYRVAGDIRLSLHIISDNYEAALDSALPRDENDAKGRRSEPPTPVSAHILDVRAEAKKDLTYFCMFILNEVNARVDDYGRRHGTISTRVDVGSIEEMCGFIDIWALAMAEQYPDDADECRHDIERHGNRLRDIVTGAFTRRFQIPNGRCPEMVWKDEELVRCNGTLVAVMRQGDALLPKAITCDFGHEWAPREWMTLGKRLIA